MVTPLRTLLTFSLLFLPACLAQQQPNHTFNWAFTTGGSFFQPCDNVQLKTIALNGADNSVAPYSVVSFEIGGFADWQYNVSTDKTNIPWVVRHRPGAQLLVSVVDSRGNDGGFPAQVFEVQDGNNVSCIPPDPVNPPVLSNVNVTAGHSINTCDLWGVSVTGGTPPYGAFVVASHGEIYTPFNATNSNNRFTYKNRAPPDNQMIIAVQDSKGVWSAATQAVKTKGSTDASCVGGLETSWISDAQFQQQAALAAAAAAQSRKTQQITTALAVVFSLLGAIVIGLALWYWLRYRRTAKSSSQLPFPPPPLDPEKAVPLDADFNRPSHGSMRTVNSGAPLLDNQSPGGISGPLDLGRTASYAGDFAGRARVNTVRRPESFALSDSASAPAEGGSPPQRANSTSPFPAGRRPSRKAIEAAEERRLARERVPPPPALSPDTTSPSMYPGPSGFPAPRRQLTVDSGFTTYSRAPSRHPSATSRVPGSALPEESEYGADGSEAGTIVFQHQDGGMTQVVLELPPAYAPSFDGPQTRAAPSVPMSAVASPVEGGAGAVPRAV